MQITFLEGYMKPIDEKIVLITIIGVLESIEVDAITTDEAEKLLFSPHTISKLYEKKCNERIVHIIEKGCELEDIISLIPESLNKVINEMKQEALNILKGYPEFNKLFWFED